jgi:hypothetical protein
MLAKRRAGRELKLPRSLTGAEQPYTLHVRPGYPVAALGTRKRPMVDG